MRESEIILVALPQADGKQKYRPALILRKMPNGDLLVCGISTQVDKYIPEFDEMISPGSDDFAHAGLKLESLARLSYLFTIPPNQAGKSIGYLSDVTHQRLLSKLSSYLNPPTKSND
jgi:mRNA interferase MazF